MDLLDLIKPKYLIWWLPPVILYWMQSEGNLPNITITGFEYYMGWYLIVLLGFKYIANEGKAQSNQLIGVGLHLPITRGDFAEIDNFIIRRDSIDIPFIPQTPLNSITVVYPKDAQEMIGENICVHGSFRKVGLRSLPLAVRLAIVYKEYNTENIWFFRFYLPKVMKDKEEIVATIETMMDTQDKTINDYRDVIYGRGKVLEDEIFKGKRITQAKRETVFGRLLSALKRGKEED